VAMSERGLRFLKGVKRDNVREGYPSLKGGVSFCQGG